MRRLSSWATLALIVVATPFVLEVAARMIVPQNLSNSWLVPGPLGQMINQANGTARHQHGQRVVHYRFNSFHQRGPEPSPETRKILMFGGSFAFGWLLEEDKTYTRLLQTKLDNEFGRGKFEILVGATAGWEMSDFLVYLETFGERIKPELIVPFITTADIHTARVSGKYRIENEHGFELTTIDRSDTHSNMRRLVRRLPGYQWLLTHSHLVQLLRNGIASLQLGPAKVFAELRQLSERKFIRFGRAFFRRMKQWTVLKDIELLVLTRGWPGEDISILTKVWVDEIMAKEGIRYFDIKPQVAGAVLKDPAAYKIAGEGHPNERGAAVIAEAVWPHLKATVERLTAK